MFAVGYIQSGADCFIISSDIMIQHYAVTHNLWTT